MTKSVEKIAEDVATARYNLLSLPEALTSLYEDAYTPPWAEESGRGSADYRRVPWSGAESVQLAYLQVVHHVARAHWVLSENTSVEKLWLVPWADPAAADWKDLDLRVPTIRPWQAVKMADMLNDAFGELQATWDDLRPPELGAADEAASHVAGAVACVPEGFGDKAMAQPKVNQCHCGEQARPGGRECQACAKRRQRRSAA